MPRPPRSYFSARQGRDAVRESLDFEAIKRLLASFLDRLRGAGYFQEAFGYDCVDSGDVPGALGSDINAYFLEAIGRERIWPYDAPVRLSDTVFPGDHEPIPAWSYWDEDAWFDVLEALHDLVSKPVEGWHHNFNGCGWHHSTFDPAKGQALFREEVSRILRKGEPAFEMSDEGEVASAAPDEFRPLLATPVPDGTEADEVGAKVAAAIRTFHARGATEIDQQRAVRDLADVLEHLRAEMKATMLSQDENALFNIANSFAIRHNNREQRRDYDRTTWFPWMFYVYLATIHAVLRVRQA